LFATDPLKAFAQHNLVVRHCMVVGEINVIV